MIELTTPRLLLRDHRQEDLQSHHQLLSDPKVMWFMPGNLTRTIEESERDLRASIDAASVPVRKHYFLRVEDRTTGEHIGEVGYTVAGRAPVGKLVEAGYYLREAFWGKGYATEALTELMRFAFAEDGVYRFACGCLKENYISERVMQKCGMIKEAEFKEYQLHDEKLKDRVEYRLLLDEWRALDSGRTGQR